ncbi:DUF4225 domain-containing protein [Pseudomonas mucidolens]|uniref:DUF4225 domain-containing protein n=1 Tax=Pseudomonas mucidolens TaxID=46679 RepID=UPI001E5FC969|nr:DUF4225 domain-containing protein [Pseudomonas mucidolens]
MSEQSCDINDVVKAASELVALGCTIGTTRLYDGIAQLQFSSIVSRYVNEVISAVNDGVISAWEGVREIKAEYAVLSSQALFYAQHGIGLVAGGMQIEAGVAITGASYGVGAPVGAFFFAHGVNNMYEGGMNIYNGPDAPATQGPTRRAYQFFLGDDYKGDIAYGAIDLVLSAGGMMRPIRKADSVEFFRRDPLNYEATYQQAGKLALLFEALVDSITINALVSGKESEIVSQ